MPSRNCKLITQNIGLCILRDARRPKRSSAASSSTSASCVQCGSVADRRACPRMHMPRGSSDLEGSGGPGSELVAIYSQLALQPCRRRNFKALAATVGISCSGLDRILPVRIFLHRQLSHRNLREIECLNTSCSNLRSRETQRAPLCPTCGHQESMGVRP